MRDEWVYCEFICHRFAFVIWKKRGNVFGEMICWMVFFCSKFIPRTSVIYYKHQLMCNRYSTTRSRTRSHKLLKMTKKNGVARAALSKTITTSPYFLEKREGKHVFMSHDVTIYNQLLPLKNSSWCHVWMLPQQIFYGSNLLYGNVKFYYFHFSLGWWQMDERRSSTTLQQLKS